MMNLTEQYQPIEFYSLPIEKNFKYQEYQRWVQEKWPMTFYVMGGYLLSIYLGQWYMKDKQALNLRRSLIIWNALLAVFSISGALKTLPELLYSFRKGGFHGTVCVSNLGDEFRPALCWTFLFVCSKIPELFDTAFIVLKKNKLIILHWYHHAIVVFYAFFTYREHPAYIRWFVSVNYTIHGIMYSYYTLRALRIRVPKPLAMMVTVMQILQMFLGCYVCAYAYVQKMGGNYCNTSYQSIGLCVAMYFSFVILFINFFLHTYFGKNKLTDKKVL